MIRKYKICTGTTFDPTGLENEVNELIESAKDIAPKWKPHGGLTVTEKGTIFQVMILE